MAEEETSVTVASKVPFFELCGLLERIAKRSGNEEKRKILRSFIDKWRDFHDKIHGNDKTAKDSFYPAMRLLLPHLEKEREAYGIKEHTLAKLYIEILGLGKDSPAAQKLLNFRAPKGSKGDAGDFANVAFWVLKPRCPEKGSLTVEEVNEALNGVATNNAKKNKDGVRKSLLHMLRNMSASEQKWLIRMIMKELKVGLSQQSIFAVFHQDAEDLFNVKMSLQAVCEMLKDPKVRMHEIEVSLFSPFRPMLGDRGAPSKMEKVMDNKSFFIETKFDGERMQLHKKNGEYKYFSRGGNDYTHVYGADEYSGNFTGRASQFIKDNIHSCILDGEMVGFDPETKLMGSKGENFDIKSTNLVGYVPMLCVFDVLMINDKILSNCSLRERKKLILDVFEPEEGTIVASEYKECRTNQDCVDALNDAIDRREEGIMVKDPDTPYKPNTRKGGWYKIKPEYSGDLMDQLDVIVVGGYFGTGHRGDILSHFLCAVAVPPEEGEEHPTKFQTFCKVGSGYTKKELYEFNKKLHPHWNVFDRRKAPQFLEMPSGFKQRPDTWIHPSKSCILQIKAAEITVSDQFKTGCTLRFPRVELIRTDKPWYDCLTTKQLEELREKSGGKLAGRHAEIGEMEEEPKKKKRKIVTRHVKPTVGSRFRGINTENIEKISEMLAGKEVCVINGSAAHPKSDLEKKVVEFGGTIVQNPGDETYCVIAEKVAIKVKNIISKGNYDVVKASWLINCAENKSYIPWTPADMIFTSEKTAASFADDYDRHGDSYYEDTTVDALKKIFKNVEEKGSSVSLSTSNIAEMEMNYFPHDSEFGLFRLCRMYLDSNTTVDDTTTHIQASTLELVDVELRLYGATVVPTLDEGVTHVVMDDSDLTRIRQLRQRNRELSKKFHIVSQSWVTDCIKREKLLKERDYEPV